MTGAQTVHDTPVEQSITVQADVVRAFGVFTEGIDSWWPRSHHIGKSPMRRVIIEGRAGGRCYTEHEDGTECDWGSILVWEAPHRFVMAWQITGQWQFEPDVARSSEVEVRFISVGEGSTRVDLSHRHFARVGAAADYMRTAVSGPSGWGGMLTVYATQVSLTP